MNFSSKIKAISCRDYFWKYRVNALHKAVFFYENSENSFYWCRVLKSASMSWVQLFATEKGITESGIREAELTDRVFGSRFYESESEARNEFESYILKYLEFSCSF